MLTLPDTLNLQLELAQDKVVGTQKPYRFLTSSMLAGAYVGIAVVTMLSIAGPFAVKGDPLTKFISGAVFAVGLILVVFAGAELVTSAMMILTQGVLARKISLKQWTGTLSFCFIGNLAGSMVFGLIVVYSGVLDYNAAAGDYLATVLQGKSDAQWYQLFLRAVLCNILVCLAIWCANRCQTEIGKATVIFWCLLAFVASGYEHVVANMTTFTLGLFHDPSLTTWMEFGRNLALVGVGNLVGGAFFVGVAYWFLLGESHSVASIAANPAE